MKNKYIVAIAIVILIALLVVGYLNMPDMEFSACGLYEWYKDHMTYTVIVILMAIESSIIPLPSEVVVPPAAYFALQEGSDLNIWMVMVMATIGATLGALINYGLSMLIGRPILYGFADSKFGRMLMLNSKKLEYAESYFQKKGAISIFLGRLLPAVRHLISIPAGLSRMNVFTFTTFTFIGAALWNVVLAGMGYLLYLAVPDANSLFDQLEHYNVYVKAVGYGLIVLVAIYIFIKVKKNSKTTTQTPQQ